MWDRYKLTQAILWRITYPSTDFTFLHFNIKFLYSYILDPALKKP